MGLFDLFKKKSKPVATKTNNTNATVSESEKEHYQPDPYYTDVVAEGTPFERKVITFEDRKKTAIPSNGGLYPAEILLLEYCSKGSYPKPKTDTPAFGGLPMAFAMLRPRFKTWKTEDILFLDPLQTV